MNLKYIVTGTGRCGSSYCAKLLTSLGIPCGHESIFDYNGLDVASKRIGGELPITLSEVSQKDGRWIDPTTIIAESSYCAAPFLNHFSVPVIHITRHPLKVISSFLRDLKFFQSEVPSNEWETFIYSQVPELTKKMLPIKRACLYYLRWNQMIEQYKGPYYRHRVEDNISSLAQFLGCEVSDNIFSNKTENTMKQRVKDIGLADLPRNNISQEFIFMTTRYGYKFTRENL